MAYHSKEIEKGVLGEFSKIKEEFLEAEDAEMQQNRVMVLLELSDLIGAIELYCTTKHNITLQDLMKMKDATKSAFQDGTRTCK